MGLATTNLCAFSLILHYSVIVHGFAINEGKYLYIPFQPVAYTKLLRAQKHCLQRHLKNIPKDLINVEVIKCSVSARLGISLSKCLKGISEGSNEVNFVG